MLALARLMDNYSVKPDGIGDPDKWIMVNSERGCYIFYTGLIDVHQKGASFKPRSKVSYVAHEISFPNCRPDSQYAEVLLYAGAVISYTLKGRSQPSQVYQPHSQQTYKLDDITQGLKRNRFSDKEIENFVSLVSNSANWDQDTVLEAVIALGSRCRHGSVLDLLYIQI